MTASKTNCAETTALILAGGLGTRLRAVVSDRPKVMASVAGHPFLSYLLQQVAEAGLSRVVLCTGYLAEQVREELGESLFGLEIDYSMESAPLGTGGAIRLALDRVPSSPVLVMNGDSFCETQLANLFVAYDQALTRCPTPAVLTLAEVPDTLRYGRVEADSQNRIVAFREKGISGPGKVNAGIYLLHRSLIESLPSGESLSLERDLFSKWLAAGMLFAHPATVKRFIDIGTPESYQEAQSLFSGNR